MATLPNPRTWSTGEYPSATQFNTEFRDTFNFLLSPPLFIIRALSSGTTVPPSSWTGVVMDQEDYDNDSGHATGSSKIQPTTAGYYEVFGNVSWPNTSTGRRIVRLAVNGNAVPGTAVGGPVPAASAIFGQHTSGIVYLNGSTDYVEIQAFQDSAASITTNFSATEQTSRLQARWIGKGP